MEGGREVRDGKRGGGKGRKEEQGCHVERRVSCTNQLICLWGQLILPVYPRSTPLPFPESVVGWSEGRGRRWAKVHKCCGIARGGVGGVGGWRRECEGKC